MKEKWHRRLKSRIEELNTTPHNVSISAGMNRGALSDIFRLGSTPKVDTLAKFADAVGWTLTQLYEGGDSSPHEIPIYGHIGAGEEVFPYDDIGSAEYAETVLAPPMKLGRATALKVVGDSMPGVYEDGDVIFYNHFERELPQKEGEVYICCLPSDPEDQLLVKKAFKSDSKMPGYYDLVSTNLDTPPLTNKKLKWAAKIKWVKRAG